MKYLLALFCLAQSSIPLALFAQQNDSTENGQVLTPAMFNEYLLSNHPVVEKADIIKQSGEFEVKKARGRFDPELFSDWNAKEFKNTPYYTVSESGLRVPTWLGLDFKLYYQKNRGQYLNPENAVPSDGLYGVGISVPIGEGLFTDQRRTALNKAKVVKQAKANERERLVMKVLNSGFRTYWDWAGLARKQAITNQTVEKARERFGNVREGFRGGEQTAIDTTDALSQLQRWQVKAAGIQGKYQKQSRKLSAYLWNDEQAPVALDANTAPPDIEELSIATLSKLLDQAKAIDSIPQNHPAIRNYENRLEMLSFENRWRKEQLKPKLDLKYHALQDAGNQPGKNGFEVSDDLRWGIAFEMPVLLRKERNSLKLNEMKINTTRLDFKNRKQSLQAELEGQKAQLKQLFNQIKYNADNLANYKRLVESEEILFENGESDLLRINLREMNYLQSRLKQIDYITQFLKLYSTLIYQYNLAKEAPEIVEE